MADPCRGGGLEPSRELESQKVRRMTQAPQNRETGLGTPGDWSEAIEFDRGFEESFT